MALPALVLRIRPAGQSVCEVCEDVAWIASSEAPGRWARRLGMSEVALARHLYRHGRRELANAVERLVQRERRAAS